MANIYEDLTDEELAAEIAAFRAARRSMLLAGGDGVGVVKRIRDGDRQLEYTDANKGDLDRELQALLTEKARREGRYTGRAIEVEFGDG